MITLLIPVFVGLVAAPFLGINPLHVLAGLSLLALGLITYSAL